MLATRIFDAINDPIIGQIVDHRKSKNGRYKPVIRAGSIALAIVFVGLMYVPEIGAMGKTIWVSVFYVLWSVCLR
jgi:GPH family glycoside/pentoside/hexuronide:cation symporter